MGDGDREQGTPQERLSGDEEGAEGLNSEPGGYDSPADQQRQGGDDEESGGNEAPAPGAGGG
jgi:hypothetical protein